MRQVDKDEPQPLGRKVERPAPAPTAPEWVPTGTPGIERHRDTGNLRNVSPPPPPEPPTYYFGTPETWGTAIDSIRQGG